MSVSTVASDSASSALSSMNSQMDAFRGANFLQIMLTEVTNQDPLNPTETSKMVESMQALQELANSTYEKYRADVGWAQNLVGKTVNVTQVGATAEEAKNYQEAGLIPNVGYGNLDGKVDSFKVVNKTVWVSIGGYDYPIDNVQQVRTGINDTNALTESATRLLGMRVKYQTELMTTAAEGVVASVGFDDDGKLKIGVGSNTYIGYDDIRAITVPSTTGTGG